MLLSFALLQMAEFQMRRFILAFHSILTHTPGPLSRQIKSAKLTKSKQINVKSKMAELLMIRVYMRTHYTCMYTLFMCWAQFCFYFYGAHLYSFSLHPKKNKFCMVNRHTQRAEGESECMPSNHDTNLFAKYRYGLRMHESRFIINIKRGRKCY